MGIKEFQKEVKERKRFEFGKNWKSFLTYLLTWVMIMLGISIFIALLISLFKIDRGSLLVLFLPISLLIMGVAHCSYYASTKMIFSDLVAKHSNTNTN